MNIKIESNFQFAVSSLQFLPNGELQISLFSADESTEKRYEYVVNLGGGAAEEKPSVGLLKYVNLYVKKSNIKDKTISTYQQMCKHLVMYGDAKIEDVTTDYIQGFITYLQSCNMKPGTVRLYFQKLACVLHDAYKNELLTTGYCKGSRGLKENRRKDVSFQRQSLKNKLDIVFRMSTKTSKRCFCFLV